jgi:hypothetical protein
MKPTLFVHTNDAQLLGAKVAAWSFKAASRRPDAFDVRFLRVEETPGLVASEGKEFRRKGKTATWHNRDLQSFTPLRFAPPQALGFEGRAIVVDPDVFALADVMELFERDMEGRPILCKWCEGYLGSKPFWATSVLVLECERLRRWRFDQELDALFRGEFDYGDWIALRREPPDSIGRLEEEWNHFDTLTPATRLLHMTERSTQPWKTGLPVEFDTMYHGKDGKRPPPQMPGAKREAPPTLLARLARGLGLARAPEPPRYLRHPDPEQERLFFTLLRGALRDGAVTEAELDAAVGRDFVRPDARRLLAELPEFDYAAFLAGRWRRAEPAAAAAGAA